MWVDGEVGLEGEWTTVRTWGTSDTSWESFDRSDVGVPNWVPETTCDVWGTATAVLGSLSGAVVNSESCSSWHGCSAIPAWDLSG